MKDNEPDAVQHGPVFAWRFADWPFCADYFARVLLLSCFTVLALVKFWLGYAVLPQYLAKANKEK